MTATRLNCIGCFNAFDRHTFCPVYATPRSFIPNTRSVSLFSGQLFVIFTEDYFPDSDSLQLYQPF